MARSSAPAPRFVVIMTSKTVKCSNCNVVINEVLAFIQNKADVMDEESLSAICRNSFSEEDLLHAKKLLFDSCASQTLKSTTRKGTGKTKRDIDDIIGFIKQVDPEKVPVFVARELHKLPPISFDHIDVTNLLKKLLILENDMLKIKKNYIDIKQYNELRQEIADIRNASIVNNFEYNNICTKRGAYLADSHCDSGPIGLTHITSPPENRIELDLCDVNYQLKRVPQQQNSLTSPGKRGGHVEASTAVSHTTTTAHHMQPACSATGAGGGGLCTVVSDLVTCANEPASNPIALTSTDVNKRSFVDAVNDGEWKKSKPDEEWTLVQRRRLKNRFIGMKGKANTESTDNFRAADIKIPLFINNVDKETSADDIMNYIFKRTQIKVYLEEIKMKYEREYNAFKVYVPRFKMDIFLDSSLWPEGISFRKYINFRNRTTGVNHSNKVASSK